jgi:hypothetical protein
MIAKITTGVVLLTALVLTPSRVAAQDNSSPDKKPQTLTGCIHTGDAVSAFKLATKDGVWNIAGSKKLKIGRQIDHTVTVTGTIIESFDTKTPDKESNRLGTLNVSKITMVSKTCAN